MVVHNASILEPHTWQASWWEWILNLRGLLYYSKDTKHSYTAGMYLIGNHGGMVWSVFALGVPLAQTCTRRPMHHHWHYHRARTAVLHLSVLPLMALAALVSAVYLRLRTFRGVAAADAEGRGKFAAVMVFCLLGYVLNLAPYLGVKRSTFIYHYMPALLYAELLAARTVDWLVAPAWRNFAVRVYVLAVAAIYLFNYPWIYAFPITNDGHARRRWLPRWN